MVTVVANKVQKKTFLITTEVANPKVTWEIVSNRNVSVNKYCC
jgi:hypothetical protein